MSGPVTAGLARVEALLAAGERDQAVAQLNAAAEGCFDSGAFGDAARLYRRLIELVPDHALAWFNCGAACEALGQLEPAFAAFRQVVALRPDLAHGYLRLGGLFYRRKAWADAAEHYRLALARRPDLADARLGLANALKWLGCYEEALVSYRAALAADPGLVTAHFNLGVTLQDLRRPEQAILAYRQALALKPDHAGAHNGLAFCLLLTGQFEEGWREHEWRWASGDLTRPCYPVPEWQGEDPAGRTLLLHGEQGHGDVLQFIRYAPLVAARGARVLVACPPALVRLIAAVEGVSAAFPLGAVDQPFDLWAPLMSLPRQFATTLATIPAAVPYLHPPADASTAWAVRLAAAAQAGGPAEPDPRPRVGLVWAGERRTFNWRFADVDQRRSLSLTAFAPLLALSGLRFISLQLGPPAAQADAPWVGGRLECPLAQGIDFADSAALIRHLDLVITVDTAAAHLAGGLGRPVWVLSRFDGCWRWLLERSDSPWYPTLRLFRQPRPGDWEPTLAALTAALTAWRDRGAGRGMREI